MADFALGMPTLIELPDLEANIEVCQRLGLSSVELNMNLPAYCPEMLAAEQLREVREKTGIGFSLHLPEEIDLASFQASIRKGHLDCCKAALAWASQAGIRIVNLHLNSGVYFSLPDRRVWLYERYNEIFVERLQDAFGELIRLARDDGTTICIENVGNFGISFVRKALDVLLGEHKEHLRLTWDVGHDAGSGFCDQDVFKKMQELIGHMHLHDSNGKMSHQILFSGKVDVAAMLSLAKDLGIAAIIETKTAESLTESVRQLRKRGMI